MLTTGKVLLYFITFISLQACYSASNNASARYYTWDGLEPDRWASIWLMKRYINPASQIELVPVGAELSNATPMAIPAASTQFKRTHGRSTYENMAAAFKQDDDPVLKQIGDIINEIEISPWNSSAPAVAVIESQFRDLQFQYNRVDVPMACYAGFFDVLYNTLKLSGLENTDALASNLLPEKVCSVKASQIAVTNITPVVEYPLQHVLSLIHADKQVVFVDTREDEEFDEQHIPGAVNLKLREVNETSVDQFKNADLILSYCIKDFRGYEVALAMSRAGLENVGIMKPYGLKGWKDMQLPVANDSMSEAEALAALKRKAEEGG